MLNWSDAFLRISSNNFVDADVISNQSLSFMQPDDSPSQSFEGTQNIPEDLIREGYAVWVSGGQTFVMLNALEGEDFHLAKVLKPNFSKAVEMARGVRVFYSQNGTITSYLFKFSSPPSPSSSAKSQTRIWSTHVVVYFSWGSPKSYIALQWLVVLLRQGLTL